MPLGYLLEYHRGCRGFGALWIERVLPHLVTRESRTPMRVPDVLAMRYDDLHYELVYRGLQSSSEKAVMVGRLLEAIGAFVHDEMSVGAAPWPDAAE